MFTFEEIYIIINELFLFISESQLNEKEENYISTLTKIEDYSTVCDIYRQAIFILETRSFNFDCPSTKLTLLQEFLKSKGCSDLVESSNGVIFRMFTTDIHKC